MKQFPGGGHETTATFYNEALETPLVTDYTGISDELAGAQRADLAMTQEAPALVPWNGSQFDMNNFLPFMRNIS